jgi:hypothetical protein
MNHTFSGFIETLEGRRHLASHPLALTPEQEAQVDLGLIAASVAQLSGSTADPPLSTQPAISTATDIVTASSSTDSLGLLVSSISPMVSGTSVPGNGLSTGGSILVGADHVTIDPGLFGG